MKSSTAEIPLLLHLTQVPPANDSPRVMQVLDTVNQLAGQNRSILSRNRAGDGVAMQFLSTRRQVDRELRSAADAVRETCDITSGNGMEELVGAGERVSSRCQEFRALVRQVARQYGLQVTWFERLIEIESGFNPDAVSIRGAMGLGQLMPDTALEWGLRVANDREEGSVWHPRSNLEVSARYLIWLHGLYGEMGMEGAEAWRFTAAAYRLGPAVIRRALRQFPGDIKLSWLWLQKTLPGVAGPAAGELFRWVQRLDG